MYLHDMYIHNYLHVHMMYITAHTYREPGTLPHTFLVLSARVVKFGNWYQVRDKTTGTRYRLVPTSTTTVRYLVLVLVPGTL